MNIVLPFILLLVSPLITSGQGFDDEFNGSIDSRWQWIRPDASRQLILGSQLTIITQNGALYGTQFNSTRNILLQEAPGGSFAIETKVNFEGDSTFHNAGLLYYVDDDNYVSMSKGVYLGEQVAMCTWEKNGSYFISTATIPSQAKLFLRLTVRDHVHYTGEYSLDGAAWSRMEPIVIEFDQGIPRIGIKASNGEGVNVTRQQLPARFDYVRVNRNVGVNPLNAVAPSTAHMEVFPMPLNKGGTGQIRIYSGISVEMNLVLLSLDGRRVRNIGHAQLQPGITTINLPMDGLAAGGYFISGVVGGISCAQTFLLLR